MPTKLLPTGAQHPGITTKRRPLQVHPRTKLWCYASPKQQANDSGNRPNPDITPWRLIPHMPQPAPPSDTGQAVYKPWMEHTVDWLLGTCSHAAPSSPCQPLSIPLVISLAERFHPRVQPDNLPTFFKKNHCDLLLLCLSPRGSNPAWRIPHVPSATINVTALQGRTATLVE